MLVKYIVYPYPQPPKIIFFQKSILDTKVAKSPLLKVRESYKEGIFATQYLCSSLFLSTKMERSVFQATLVQM